MSLKRFESFLRRMSRILYEDDLTPLIFDYLLKNQMYALESLHFRAEHISLTVFLRLQFMDNSPYKVINRAL